MSTGADKAAALGLLGLAVMVAAWFASGSVVAALAAAAVAAAAWDYWGTSKALAILPAGLLIMLAGLVRLGERLPRSYGHGHLHSVHVRRPPSAELRVGGIAGIVYLRARRAGTGLRLLWRLRRQAVL